MPIAVGNIDRYEFYYGQKVKQTELNEALDAVEEGLRRLMVDNGSHGVHKNPLAATASEGVISENSPTGTSVLCQKFFARTKQGDRIERNVDTGSIDLTVDKDGASTDPPSGEERYLSIFAVPKRGASDARVDKAGASINFVQDQSFAFEVVAGTSVAQAVPTNAVKPSLRDDAVLLADILVQNGFSSITDAANPLSPGVNEIDLLRVEKFTARAYRVEADEYLKINSNLGSSEVTAENRIYREAIPLAWGAVNALPSPFLENNFNCDNLVRDAAGLWTIDLADDLGAAIEDLVVIVTARVYSVLSPNTIISANGAPYSSGGSERKIKVIVSEYNGTSVSQQDHDFQFVVFGRLSL